MTIRLQHTQTHIHKVTATFVRGDSPLLWLQEISRWEIAPQHLSCYVLPQSLQSPLPAGLFVIIHHPASVASDVLLNPYGVIADKLYVPVDTTLYPECTKEELQKLLIWDVQVFHPTIGLVGFDKKDTVPLTDLLQDIIPSSMLWNKANPGLPSRLPLQQIQVVQLTPEDLFEEMRKELGAKPLDEIPGAGDGKTTLLEKGIDTVKYGLFKGMFAAANALEKIFQFLPSGSGQNTDSTGNGWLDKWREWLSKNIEFIEKKRQDEIQRLLSMFEDDSDEALQYAIPLDSAYLNRGKALPTSQLTRRPLNFNLGKLGGGGAVDSWDIGDHYFTLRQQYTSAAQKAVEKGDFKKAAYVYAHLLGDFQSAANVLMQGKYYREAAALYRDHLKNKTAAAECLEKGGLMVEAIELYKDLDKPEKVGDLYTILGQVKNADVYFEKTVRQYLTVHNYLEAARVLQDKQGNDSRAKKVLLDGWQRKEQPESCLKKYFSIVSVAEPDRMRYQVDKIYKDTPDSKQHQFLNVLHHVKQRADNELAARTVNIAYEIVSRKADKNDMSLLPQLKQFILRDALLPSDISRYIHKHPKQAKNNEQWTLQLDDTVQWQRAIAFRNQVVVFGIKDKKLQLGRFNWYKDTEYNSYPDEVSSWINEPIANPYVTNLVMLKGISLLHNQRHHFFKNKYFSEEVVIGDEGSFPSSHAGLAFNGNGDVVVLDGGGGNGTLHYYSSAGNLKKSKPCQSARKEALQFYNAIGTRPLLQFEDWFITASGSNMVAVDANGIYTWCAAGSGIRMYTVSRLSPVLKMVVSTNAGCRLGGWKQGELYLHTNVFATDAIPSLLQFIAADRFVLAEKNTLSVYDISEQDLAVFVRAIEVDSKVIAMLSSSVREKFAVIEETGFVTLHDI